MKLFQKFPDTLLILLAILCVFTLLTWIVPAGEFDRAELNGRTVVVPNSYHAVPAQPQGVGAFLMAPIKGFEAAADIIAFVLMVGGSFAMLTRTGAIDAGLHRMIHLTQEQPSLRQFIIPLLMVLFSLGGATFGMSEEVLVFVLITIPMAKALGYDAITGIAIAFVGAGAGFAGAFLNPFTVGIAQGIAELPPFSGFGYRMVVWTVMTLIVIVFVMRYARRIYQVPTPETLQNTAVEPTGSFPVLDFRKRLILIFLLLTLVMLVIGANRWGWYIHEITALFLAMGTGAAIIGQLSVSDAIDAFKSGTKDMLTPVLIIALARALIVVAGDGKVVDTLLNNLASAADGLPQVVSVQVMFFLQSALNFFVPSGSGQAALTMPIMAPMSDLLGISRQVAVLAFQLGDGLSNMIIPTSGVTMGVIAIADIPYDRWFKWMLPLFLILTLAGMVLLALPVLVFAW